MTAPMPVSNDSQVNPAAAAPSASNSTTAGAIAQSNAPAAVTGNTKIGTLADLKKKSPQLYKVMMESISENMRSDLQKHQDALKKAMRGDDN